MRAKKILSLLLTLPLLRVILDYHSFTLEQIDKECIVPCLHYQFLRVAVGRGDSASTATTMMTTNLLLLLLLLFMHRKDGEADQWILC